MVTRLSGDHVCVEPAARLRFAVTRHYCIAARAEVATRPRSEYLHLVISGVAARCRSLPDGRRQITALILPGDLCKLEDHFSDGSTGNIVALSACTIGEIPRSALFTDRVLRPEWSEFAFRALARECAIAAEWNVSLGRRSAYEAAAHLFCELWARLDAVGQTADQSFAFPLTQVDLADVLGLTSVHTNRTLRDLRNAGLLTVAKKRATIHDFAALRHAADFDPTYLQIPMAAISRPDKRGYSETTSRARRPSQVSSSLGSTLEA